jgi:hypothetical protein
MFELVFYVLTHVSISLPFIFHYVSSLNFKGDFFFCGFEQIQ